MAVVEDEKLAYRLPNEVQTELNRKAEEFIINNPGRSNKWLSKYFTFSYNGKTIPRKPKFFQRLKKEIEKKEKKYKTESEEHEIWVLPGISPKKWVEGSGYLDVPELLNGWLVKSPASTRKKYYYYIRDLYNALKKKHPHTWKDESIIDEIWRHIDTKFNTFGISHKKKHRAYTYVGAIRSLIKYLGWTDREIESYFPQPLKAPPLKDKVVDSSVLYFTEEEVETYIDVAEATLDKMVKEKEITKLRALQILFYLRYALDTGTRQGIANAWSPDRTFNMGKGICGLHISNIQWDDPVKGYANCPAQDKGGYLWKYKYITPETVDVLKDLLEEHRKIFGQQEDRLFPSNDGLAEMKQKKNVSQELALTRFKINKIIDKINWVWWGEFQSLKGNPNLRKEDGCPVTVRSHFFRHTFAAKCIANNVDSYFACQIGGWKDMSTFKNIYADAEEKITKSIAMEFLHKDTSAVQELKQRGIYKSTKDVLVV